MEKNESYQKGWTKLEEINKGVREKIVNNFKEIAPELSDFIIEYSFGTIYSRNLLDSQAKSFTILAALIALGTAPAQLKMHFNIALNTQSTISQLKEVVLQMSVYAGFPKCINAMAILKEVVEERKKRGIQDKLGIEPTKIDNRQKAGEDAIAALDPLQVDRIKNGFSDISTDLVKFTFEYGYGDIFSRDNLSKKYRQIATIAALGAMGTAHPQLKFHITGALNIGVTSNEIKEVMLLLTVFAGFPAGINGMQLLKDILNERKSGAD